MKKRSRVALAGLLLTVVGGIVWWVSIHRTADAGQGTPISSLEFRDVTADFGRSTNLIAVGEWSKPVKDKAGYTLSGRLLVFAMPHYLDNFKEWWGNSPVYLELQNLSPRTDKTLAVYFALGDGLECEMRDGRDKALGRTPRGWISGSMMPYTRQYWVTVPFAGSVRLRADPSLGGFSPKPNGVVIQFDLSKRWTIPAGDTNSWFLCGTFSPPTNHPSPPDSHVWEGKLALPAVKIPVP